MIQQNLDNSLTLSIISQLQAYTKQILHHWKSKISLLHFNFSDQELIDLKTNKLLKKNIDPFINLNQKLVIKNLLIALIMDFSRMKREILNF